MLCAENSKEVDAFAVCQDFDVMRNEYFMSYETYNIVLFPPHPSSHTSLTHFFFFHPFVCVLIKSAQLKMWGTREVFLMNFALLTRSFGSENH
jgi:hypothetical protein